MDEQTVTPANIVILGGGFGGVACALELGRLIRRHRLNARARVFLVDRQAGQLYQPALYEAAASTRADAPAFKLKQAITVPYDEVLVGTGVRFIQAEVLSVNPVSRTVKLRGEPTLPYTHLVLALGAEPNFFDIPGLAEHAFTFKSFTSIIRLRNRISEALRRGERHPIVICGGGTAGVEVAGELVGLLRKLGLAKPDIAIFEANPEILSGFHPAVVAAVSKRLGHLGVRVRTATKVVSADAGGIRVTEAGTNQSEYVRSLVTIWAGGIQPNRILKELLVPHDARGRAEVSGTLRCAPNTYAIGDNSCFVDPKTNKPLPAVARIAIVQGKVAARNAVAAILRQPLLPYSAHRYPIVIPVGGKWAMADLIHIRISGFLGWCIKQLVELLYLSSILPFSRAILLWIRGVSIYLTND
ncbi:FAD-dependent oxidoreductase [Candidatus Parcubacteria bacterium]|nr:FAD-dependent oxidoreductase [Candidatus Parcubacteria bacterium]MBI4098956.1 FAD-dependent oxidoreductase [Candidatus Parcubacteria bacterium]MBI4385636.1 FAD-dependent oxidoreductase [Candidatus Parcubacteria bacterium]